MRPELEVWGGDRVKIKLSSELYVRGLTCLTPILIDGERNLRIASRERPYALFHTDAANSTRRYLLDIHPI